MMKHFNIVEVGSHPTLESPGKGLGIKAIASSLNHTTLYIAFGKNNETIDRQNKNLRYTIVEIPFNHKPLRTTLNLQAKISRTLIKIWVILIFIFKMRFELSKFSYDIINIHSLMLLPTLLILPKNIHKIVTFRGSDIELFQKSIVMRHLATHAHEFHCVSLAQKKYLNKHYGKKVTLINNFVDFQFFKKKMTADRYIKKNIVVVAGLRQVKGVDRSLLIFREILKLDKDWTLNICGNGPEMSKLINYCKTHKIDNSVIFHGTLTREKLRTVLHDSSICMIDSRNEGFPKAMLEAMAAGCYISHSGKGDCSRILEGNGSAYSVFTPKTIAQNLIQQVSNFETLLQKSDVGISIAQKYDQETYCARIERAYSEILS